MLRYLLKEKNDLPILALNGKKKKEITAGSAAKNCEENYIWIIKNIFPKG